MLRQAVVITGATLNGSIFSYVQTFPELWIAIIANFVILAAFSYFEVINPNLLQT